MHPLNLDSFWLKPYSVVTSFGLLPSSLKESTVSQLPATSVPIVGTSTPKDGVFGASAQALQMVLPGAAFMALTSVFGTLTTLLATSNQNQDLIMRPNPPPTEAPLVYDFIVVGSGTAGGIIANRLSENGFHEVLLLEAGGDPLPMNQVPFLFHANLNRPETDWGYRTVPQKYSAFSLINSTITYPQGRSVGGSSNINEMIYMRGCPKDFDNWAAITGDTQWNYESVLPYFKKSERYEGLFKGDLLHHGRQGPIYVTIPPHQRLLQEWLEAGQEFGYPIADPNARQTSLFSPMEVTLGEGVRWGTYEGYIKPALRRPNFKLIRYAHVLRINLNGRNEATGVTYLRNGQVIEVRASKEVILCAGAIGSPQLLMLSGIGPAQELISHGIKPMINLPAVGKGLLDHPTTWVGPFLHNDSISLIPERDLTYSDAINYLTKKEGPFASTPNSGIAAISTRGDPTWPDIIAFQSVAGITPATIPAFQSLFDFNDGQMEKYLGGLETQDASWVVIFLGRPKSLGEVRLASNNPLDRPLIDPNYYSDSAGADIKSMVEAYKFFVDLLENAQTYKKYNTTFHQRPFPGCEQFYGDRDKDFECRIRHWTSTAYHPSSTCRMGKHNDPNAVVDSILRVRGVRKLRVADASVMPSITNANINAPVMMIAEKAADFILQDWCTPVTPTDPDSERKPFLILDRVKPSIFSQRRANSKTPEVAIPCPIQPS